MLSIGRKVECDMRETRLIDFTIFIYLFYFYDQPTTYLQRLFFLFSFFLDTTKHPINAIAKALDPQRSRQKSTYLQN